MLTKEQKVLLNKVSVWKPVSFPNGSSYQKQFLPEGSFDGFNIEKHIFSRCWLVTWADGTESEIAFARQSVGKGSDLGVHFCTRDQALAALL